MFVRITQHAVRRFRERICDLSWPDVSNEIKRQLAATADLSGARLRALHGRQEHLDYWVNDETGAVFVVDTRQAEGEDGTLTVVSVLTEDMASTPRTHPKGTNQKRAGKAPAYGHDFHRHYRRDKRLEDV
jgi:hypothetical protein